MGSGDDTVTFNDATDFSSFTSEFTNITDAGGNDSLDFDSGAVSGSLDFSKLTEFETLNLTGNADNVTLSGATDLDVNGGAGNDTFALDFSNIANFDIDGEAGTANKVDVNSASGLNVASDGDEIFGNTEDLSNIQHLDISGLNGGAGFSSDDSKEFAFTTEMLEDWLGASSGELKLTLTSAQAEDISFTDSTSQVHDTTAAGTSQIVTGTSYNLDTDTSLLIEIV